MMMEPLAALVGLAVAARHFLKMSRASAHHGLGA
jgi:hypothetical protein